MQICEERRIQNHLAPAVCEHGRTLSASGEAEKGLAQIAQGMITSPSAISLPMQLALQADAQLAVNMQEAA